MKIEAISSDTLEVLVENRIATIVLDRPQVLNALDRRQRRRFSEALQAVDAMDDVGAVVITGRGTRAFCAGQDQNESAEMTADDSDRRIQDYMALYRIFRGMTKPLIARIDGFATGSGLQIALLCDYRVASDNAKVGMPELKVGSAAIMGSALMLPIVGEGVMKRLVLTAEIMPAREALALGILHEVHPDVESLDARVKALATKLAGWQPMAIAITRQWWKSLSDADFEQAAEICRTGHARNFASGSYTEGARRFKAKKSSATD